MSDHDHDALGSAPPRAGAASVVVDTSKSPMYLAALSGAVGIQVDTVHLVRDPRACASSWLRPYKEPVGTVELPRLSVVHSALTWVIFNLLGSRVAHSAGRYVCIRYEDLMADPRATMARVGDELGRPFPLSVIAPDGVASVRASHTVAGNPSRFRSGSVALVADETWQTHLGWRPRMIVTALTWPALRRFGYRARPRAVLSHTPPTPISSNDRASTKLAM